MKKMFLFLMLSVSIFLNAQDLDYSKLIEKLKIAATEEDVIDRLIKYDSILVEFGIKDSVEEINEMSEEIDNSNWTSNENVDPITDKRIITFWVESKNKGSKSYSDNPTLFIRATSDSIELFIVWDAYLGNDTNDYKYEKKNVTFRIGKETAQTSLWSNSTDNTASFYPDDVLFAIKKISVSDNVIARCTPYNESPITAEFTVSGFKDEWMKYDSLLNWSRLMNENIENEED